MKFIIFYFKNDINEAAKQKPAKNDNPEPAGSGNNLMTTVLILFFALIAGIIFSRES